MSTSTLIRTKLVQMLTGIIGLPTPMPERIAPPQDAALPALSLYLTGETAERGSDVYQEKRHLKIELECNVLRDANFATALDTLGDLIQAKLATDQTLGNLTISLDYLGFTAELGVVADADAARRTFHYEAVYIWEPAAVADSFLTAKINIDMAGPRNDPQLPSVPDGQIDASATVTLPT